MKNKSIFSYFAIVATFLFFTNSVKLYSLNYTISFTGSGASTTIDNVIVYNLTKGTNVTVPAGNVLNLTDIATEVENMSISDKEIRIFPNPIKENAYISFYNKKSGNTQIFVYSLDGRQIIGITENLLQGNNSFRLTLPKGIYLIRVQGNEFSYHAKVISEITNNPTPNISFSQSSNQNRTTVQKIKCEVTSMLYSSGDQLLYKGISGNYSTIVTDKPNENKTTNFEFVQCTDADGNNYSVVKIGTQTWIAENLRYLPSVSTSNLGSNLIPYYYVYGYYGSNINEAKTTLNFINYGVLYNWNAALASVPQGWHLPSDFELNQLENYLADNGYNFDGTFGGGDKKIAKSIASIDGWVFSQNMGSVGNLDFPNFRNKSGFTARPGGRRNNLGLFVQEGSTFLMWSSSEITATIAFGQTTYSDNKNFFRYESYKEDGFSVRCIKNGIPILSSTSLSNIKSYLVDCESSIIDNGGSAVTSKGFCWSKITNPTINDSKIISNSPSNLLTLEVSGLDPNTTYYLRSFAINQDGVAYGSQVSFTTSNLKLGDLYKGGSIAYIFQVGDPGYIEGEIHGLIANLYDLSTGIRWGGTSITTATSGSIGWGQSNTNKIIDILGEGSYAARLCYDLVIDNYDDWYLPSFDELEKIYYGAKSIISGQGYWSSTEISNTYAYCKFFGGSGGPVTNTKSTQYRVRAVRNF